MKFMRKNKRSAVCLSQIGVNSLATELQEKTTQIVTVRSLSIVNSLFLLVLGIVLTIVLF